MKQVKFPGVTTVCLSDECLPAAEFFGWKEPSMARELLAFSKAVAGMETFLDVGANYGIFCSVFCNLNPKGIALAAEPDPRAIEILKKNTELNRIVDRVILEQCALGSEIGELVMKESGPHYVAERNGNYVDQKRVRLTTIDQILTEQKIRPQVVKIDVEGFELEVLKGARTFLASEKPLLFLEIHPSVETSMEEDLFRLLKEIRYTVTDEKQVVVASPAECYMDFPGGAYRVIAS